MPLVKHYFVTTEEDDNQFKITCQRFKCFVTCKVRIGELLYINFLRAELSTLVLYPEDIDTENFYFQWHARTKIQRMYHKFLK